MGGGFGEQAHMLVWTGKIWYEGVGGWWVGAFSDMVRCGEMVSWCVIGRGVGEQVLRKTGEDRHGIRSERKDNETRAAQR